MAITTGTVPSIGTLGWHTTTTPDLGDYASIGTLGWHLTVLVGADSGPSSNRVAPHVRCNGRDPVEIRRAVSQLDELINSILIVRHETGDPEKGREGQMCLNTVDNTFKFFAKGYWRPCSGTF